MTRKNPGDLLGDNVIGGAGVPNVFEIIGQQRCLRDGRESFINFHNSHTDIPNHNFSSVNSCPSDNNQSWMQVVPYNAGWIVHQNVTKSVSPGDLNSYDATLGDYSPHSVTIEIVTYIGANGDVIWQNEFDPAADFGVPTNGTMLGGAPRYEDLYFVTGNQNSRVLTCVLRDSFLGAIGPGGANMWRSRYDWVDFSGAGAINARTFAFNIDWWDSSSTNTSFKPVWTTNKTYRSGTGYIVGGIMGRLTGLLCLTSDLDYVAEIGSSDSTVVPGGNTFRGRWCFPSHLEDDRVNVRLVYGPSSGSTTDRTFEIWSIDFDGTTAPSMSLLDTITVTGIGGDWMPAVDGYARLTAWNEGDGTKSAEYWYRFGDPTPVLRPNAENVEEVFTTFDGGSGDAYTPTHVGSVVYTVTDWNPSTGIDHTGSSPYNGDRYGFSHVGVTRFNYIDWNTGTAGYVDYNFALPDAPGYTTVGQPYNHYGDFDLDDASVFVVNPHSNRALIWQRYYWAALQRYGGGTGEDHGQSFFDTYVIAQIGTPPVTEPDIEEPEPNEIPAIYQLKIYSAVDNEWYFIPSTGTLNMGFEYCDTGAIDFSYDLHGVNADKVVEDSMAAVYCNGVELINGRWHIQAAEGSAVSDDGYSKWIGRSMLSPLEKVLVLGLFNEGSDKKVVFENQTVGYILNYLFAQAQTRGAMTGYSWSFDATNDSNGVPWTVALEGVITVQIPVTTKYADVLRNLVSQGLIEFQIHKLEIQVFKNQTMRHDLADSIILHAGLDYLETPYRRTVEDRAQFVVVSGGESAAQHVTSVGTPGPFGREEAAIQQSGTSDAALLGLVGAQYLTVVDDPRAEYTRRVINRVGGPKHALDYMVGDYISDRVGSGVQSMLVRSIVINVDADNESVANLVLNDKFYEQELRNQMAIDRMIDRSAGNVTTDAEGNAVGGVTTEGTIFGKNLIIDGDPWFRGQPLFGLTGQRKDDIVSYEPAVGRDLGDFPIGSLEGYAQGVIAWAEFPAGTFATVMNSGDVYHLFNIACATLPGRSYSVRTPPLLGFLSGVSAGAYIQCELRRTTDGTEPSPTNAEQIEYAAAQPSSSGRISVPGIEARYNELGLGSDNEVRYGLVVKTHNCTFDIGGSTLWIYMSDEGMRVIDSGLIVDDTTGATVPTAPKIITKTYTSDDWATYRGSGDRYRGGDGSPGDTDGHVYQGYSTASDPNGNQRGLWTFPSSIASDFSSIRSVEAIIDWQWWYYNSSSLARIATHSYLSGAFPTDTTTDPTLTFAKEEPFLTKSGRMVSRLPDSVNAGFASGALRGFGIGPAPNTSQLYYGQANPVAYIRVTGFA